MSRRLKIAVAVILLIAVATAWLVERGRWHTLEVTATAYNSLPEQTAAVVPDIAAWGDKLKPGMRAIAVSRDLLKEGLVHRSRVRIDGLDGEWIVLDKMNKRWKRKVDIYMGTDVKAAREWGKRKVIISFRMASSD